MLTAKSLRRRRSSGSSAAPPRRRSATGLAREANILNRRERAGRLWLPLVDEPIAAIVSEIEAEDPELRALVASPEKLLAFRTFANIRVGIVLGRLLVEEEVEAYDGSETWVETLLENPGHRARSRPRFVPSRRSSLEARDRRGPRAPTRRRATRFREFARRELGD